MLKIFLPFVLLTSLCNAAQGSSMTADVGIGYRQDQLSWNFDGGASGPNILSELKWKDLNMINYYGQITACASYCSYVRLTGNYGEIFSGKNTDWDYHGDNRTDAFSHAKNKADRGEAFELSCALGFVFDWIPFFTIIPLAGYSLQEQHLQFYDGIQVFYEGSSYNNTPIPDLASNYRAKWYTPFIGADVIFCPTERLKFIATGEWHWGQYRGTGFWNLRTDFLSDVRHKANETGAVIRLQSIYKVFGPLTMGMAAEYIGMDTSAGINEVDINDPLFNSSGQFIEDRKATARGKLNVVHWRSWRIMITGGFDF